MKKELLRFRGVSVSENNRILIKELDTYILSGELLGICGLHDSGKSVLARALCGTIDCTGSIYKAEEYKISKYISEKSQLIDSLSLYENLFLAEHSLKNKIVFNARDQKEKTRTILSKAGLFLPVNMLAGELSRSQRIMFEILKVSIENPQLIVLDGIADIWREEEQEELYRVISLFPDITFVYVCSHMDFLLKQCHRTILMRGRRIAAVLDRRSLSEERLEAFSLGQLQRKTIKRFQLDHEIGPVAMRIPIYKNENAETISIHEGEIVGLVSPDLRYSITEEYCNDSTIQKIEIRGRHCKTLADAVDHGLQFLDMNKPVDQLFDWFTDEENIYYPLMKRLSTLGIVKQNLKSYLKKENLRYPGLTGETGEEDTDALRIVLQRFWLAKPKVAIINYTPSGYHPKERMAVTEVIHELANIGTAFLLILSDLESGNEVCDRVAIIDDEGNVTNV